MRRTATSACSPVIPGPNPRDAFGQGIPVEQAIQRSYYQDCFAIFGIRDALSAQANNGCVTLGRQYRFGPVITELANAVVYRGVLRMSDPGCGDVNRNEIVLIDVDGLGDELASVRRGPTGGRWWPVGALISHAIADREVRRAEEAGEPGAPGSADVRSSCSRIFGMPRIAASGSTRWSCCATK